MFTTHSAVLTALRVLGSDGLNGLKNDGRLIMTGRFYRRKNNVKYMVKGDVMNTKFLRKHAKKLVSMLPFFSVMASLLVPFEVYSAEMPEQSATGAGDAATDENIYALLYIKDMSKTTTAQNNNVRGYSTTRNMELVFQNTPDPDPSKILIEKYSGFAGKRYHSREIKVESSVPEIKNGKWEPLPWYESEKYTSTEKTARNIVSVNFRDKIAPTYIASWFYGFLRIKEFRNLENLDTSNCKDMSYAFYCSTTENWTWDEPEVLALDFSHFDTSKVEEMDNFIRLKSPANTQFVEH